MIKKLFLTLFLTSIFFACVKKRDLTHNTVIAHILSQPDGLHPFNDNSVMRSYIFNYTQKTLLKLDLESLDYIPVLIKELPSASKDNLSFEYEIKDNIEAIREENEDLYIWSQNLSSISNFNNKKILINNIDSEHILNENNDFDDIVKIHLGKKNTELLFVA